MESTDSYSYRCVAEVFLSKAIFNYKTVKVDHDEERKKSYQFLEKEAFTLESLLSVYEISLKNKSSIPDEIKKEHLLLQEIRFDFSLKHDVYLKIDQLLYYTENRSFINYEHLKKVDISKVIEEYSSDFKSTFDIICKFMSEQSFKDDSVPPESLISRENINKILILKMILTSSETAPQEVYDHIKALPNSRFFKDFNKIFKILFNNEIDWYIDYFSKFYKENLLQFANIYIFHEGKRELFDSMFERLTPIIERCNQMTDLDKMEGASAAYYIKKKFPQKQNLNDHLKQLSRSDLIKIRNFIEKRCEIFPRISSEFEVIERAVSKLLTQQHQNKFSTSVENFLKKITFQLFSDSLKQDLQLTSRFISENSLYNESTKIFFLTFESILKNLINSETTEETLKNLLLIGFDYGNHVLCLKAIKIAISLISAINFLKSSSTVKKMLDRLKAEEAFCKKLSLPFFSHQQVRLKDFGYLSSYSFCTREAFRITERNGKTACRV